MSSTGWIAPSSAAARCNGMELLDKLAILTDAAKYDAACTSSGVRRSARPGMIGNTTSSIAGCCHSFSADGRCVTLLKVLMTNRCVYDCKYCVNRRSNEAKRAMFTPEELAQVEAAVRSYQPFDEVLHTRAGCTVSSHCGPRTLGILYFHTK